MPRAPTPSRISTDRDFVRRVFIVVVVGALIAAVWALSDILLLLFGSVLLAIALSLFFKGRFKKARLQSHGG